MNRPHASDQDDQDAAEEGSHGAHSPQRPAAPAAGPMWDPRGQRLGVGAGPRGAAVTPDAGRRQSKMGSAIEVLWKSWDDLDGGGGGEDPDGRPRGVHGHGPGADAALLAASASRKSRLTPYSPTQPRSPFQPRRPSTTLWDLKDLKDARSSPRSPLSLSRSPLSTGLGAAAAVAAASLGAEHTGIKVYKRRWLMLAIFIFLGITNTFQWVQYSIIARIVQRYYNVKSFYVDLTCTSFLIAYLLCFIPASWYLDRHGLRWTLIVAAGLTSLGSWVKVGSVGRDRFWVTMVGQVVVAVGQVFMLFLPPRLASVWFGPDQVSLACSLGFIGILMGNAAGMLLPPLLVPNSDDIAQVGADLRSMFLGMAACTTASLVIQLALFQEEPPLPPSPAQQLQRDREDEGQTDEFWTSLRRLLADKQFMLVLCSWAMNVGVYCAINTLLSQLVLPHHPNCDREVGVVGLIMIASGILGSLLCGFFLDRTHKFKSCTQSLYILSLLGWGAFTFLLPLGDMTWVQATAVVYGRYGLLEPVHLRSRTVAFGAVLFAMTAAQPVGLEFAAEMTFPEPEGTTAALLISAVQLSGIVLTFAGGYIMERAGGVWTMVFLGVPLLLACVILHFVRPELKRQAAQHAPRRLSRLMSI